MNLSITILCTALTAAMALFHAPPLWAIAKAHSANEEQPYTNTNYVGMWETADGRIRQELLANGRYDEARGTRESAYQGRYELRGNHIYYWDDTGFEADGVFISPDELHHGGMVFRRSR